MLMNVCREATICSRLRSVCSHNHMQQMDKMTDESKMIDEDGRERAR